MTYNYSLFPEDQIEAPPTEGIKYTGSKRKLLPHILSLIKFSGAKTVLDGFSGTTRVSQALARSGYTVVSNDITAWSRTFGTCYLLAKEAPEHFQELIDHLNGLPPVDGWFTHNYGANAALKSDVKRPWQIHNTRKLDAIREEIERLSLSDTARAVALASLILALDQVDSTLGHYASYLRQWSPRSFKQMKLRVPALFSPTLPHQILQEDVFKVAGSVPVDLAYFDPPYGSNNEKMPPSRVRYASYYHVWTSVCLYDKPQLFGKANRRSDTSDTDSCSVFEEFRRGPSGNFLAVEAIHKLLRETIAPWILLSYSSGGRATAKELEEAIQSTGILVKTVELDYKRNVMGDMRWTHEWTADAAIPNREFLFLIRKHG